MLKVLAFLLWIFAYSASAAQVVTNPSVSGLDKSSCRAFGVNYYNVFERLLSNPRSQDYKLGFSELSFYNIPFIRFSATGYWPIETGLYLKQPDEFFRRLDLIFQEAESKGIGLIPSLFFNFATVPDLVGETRKAWADKDSKTVLFMENFVDDFFTRYSDSPSLWAVEFTNEVNLVIDLPNADKFRPPIHTNLGTPSARSHLDDISLDEYISAVKIFSDYVKGLDPDILISTGAGYPRPFSYNNSFHNSWNLDSQSQFVEILTAQHSSNVDLLSIHLYPEHKLKFGQAQYKPLIDRIALVSNDLGKPIFVGEFGVPSSDDIESERREFSELIDALYKSEVNMAALWVYRFKFQKDSWEVLPSNNRRYQLKLLQKYNSLFLENKELCGI